MDLVSPKNGGNKENRDSNTGNCMLVEKLQKFVNKNRDSLKREEKQEMEESGNFFNKSQGKNELTLKTEAFGDEETAKNSKEHNWCHVDDQQKSNHAKPLPIN
jgi:hypothetical protein